MMIMRNCASPENRRSDIQFQIYKSDDFHEKVAPFCDDLQQNAPYKSPAFSRPWLETQIAETPKNQEVLFLSFWHNNSMIGLFPLCISRVGVIRIATPLGHDPISCQGMIQNKDYNETVPLLAEEITKRKLFDLLYINDRCNHDKVTSELYECLKKRKWGVHSVYRNCCYGVDVHDSLDQLKESYGQRKSFQKLLRKERKLHKDFNVEVECISEPDNSPGVIGRIIDIQQNSWLRHRGNFMLEQNPHYITLIQNSLRMNHGYVYFLKLNEEDAAFAFGIHSGGKLCLLWTAFREKYASSYSIGVMLMMHIIKTADSKHIKRCYFCHGDSEWKRRLANHSLKIERAIAANGVVPKIAARCFYQICLLHQNKAVNFVWEKVKKAKGVLKGKICAKKVCQ
ncbi:MAG: GNAT family N-acetyltransferase [Planctomycetota bacterium]|jgi:CelD/BcsL family acetyltransferase involved in cellulose biosynthesis